MTPRIAAQTALWWAAFGCTQSGRPLTTFLGWIALYGLFLHAGLIVMHGRHQRDIRSGAHRCDPQCSFRVLPHPRGRVTRADDSTP